MPPSYGPHWATPVLGSRPFYTAKDRPEMEQLVHNLEHGYTIVWYDSTIKGDAAHGAEGPQRQRAHARRDRPRRSSSCPPGTTPTARSPSGKHIGISHWGAADSHIQLCGKVSGEVVTDFIKKYPAADSPEPTAA